MTEQIDTTTTSGGGSGNGDANGVGDEPREFELDGELPWGRLTIEASAGTGKTYTLCQLVVRYIAEADVAASEFLIVTFTRAATAELRGRIRDAIVRRITELSSDETDLPSEQIDRQLTNLGRSLTEYDTITITTIHSFATQTLRSLGSTARVDPPTAFADEDDETIRAACSDAILRAAANGVTTAVLPTIDQLLGAVGTARSTPDVVIEPTDPEDEPTRHHVLASLVGEVLARLKQQRSMRGTVSFDDVLTGLRDTIDSPEADGLIDSLRNRYRVVMIDEFQDTDPIQWAIFGKVFGPGAPGDTAHGKRSLILVGDPKQSIYAFRGADISTYRAAVTSPGMRRVALRTNWRSDGRLLDGLEALLSGTTYGNGIGFVPVHASEKYRDRHALDRGEPIVPVRVRLALGDDIERTSRGIRAEAARDAVWADLVARVHHTLDHVEIPIDEDEPGADGQGDHRRAKPSDVAVLVRTGRQALEVQQLLIDSGVPAVLSRAGRVLESPAAQQWRWLLDALVRPADARRARRFALGWFGGMGPAELDSADEAMMTTVFERLRSWLEALRTSGVTTFVERVLDDSEVIPRLLRRADGDRAVTDLMHVGELLGTIDHGRTPTAAGLLDLIQPGSGSAGVDEADEYARRVETQDPAVQIMTIWVSKGLEFPIVLVPTLFTDFPGNPEVVFDRDGHRVFDVSGDDAPAEHIAIARSRRIEETLRLAYVALTRASHQVTTWWATSNNSAKSALSRILFARDEDGTIDPDVYAAQSVTIPRNAGGADLLRPVTTASGGLVSVDVIGAPLRRAGRVDGTGDGVRDETAAHPSDTVELRAEEFGRSPDRSSNRWSFTAITSSGSTHADPEDHTLGDAGAGDEHHGPGDSSADTIARSTEPGNDHLQDAAELLRTGAANMAIPLGWLPAGADFGTLVHTVYERIDFTDADLDRTIREVVRDELDWRQLDLTPPLIPFTTAEDGLDLLSTGIRRTLETPLGPLFDGRSLDTIGGTDRLRELSFEFLLGGDRSTRGTSAPASDREIGRLVGRWLDDGDPLAPWAADLSQGRFGVDLAGHMTGSIDAVFRVGEGDRTRFVISDYKTNRLVGPKEPPDPRQYAPTSMTDSMIENHYPLQALIYSVALHRYLRSRLPDYDPSVHLGGVAYLFVRGMVGRDAPVVDGHTTGVWSWEPPAGLTTELSDLLAGAQRTGVHEGGVR